MHSREQGVEPFVNMPEIVTEFTAAVGAMLFKVGHR